jgi:hypothetical protein
MKGILSLLYRHKLNRMTIDMLAADVVRARKDCRHLAAVISGVIPRSDRTDRTITKYMEGDHDA